MDPLGAPPIVGVDLGKRTLKVVAVRGGKRSQLAHAAIHPIPQGAIDGGVILDPPAVIDTLRAALDHAKIRRGRTVLGMGGRNVVVRHLKFPPMPEDELKSAVRWEAERHLPLRIEEAVLDAQVLREVTEDGQRRLEVLMAAVPERDALLYHQIATEAGLDVVAIEATSVALARILGEGGGTTAVVDVGPDITEIVIVSGRLPLVCRSVPIGDEGLSRSGAGQEVRAEAEPGAPPPLEDLLTGLNQSIDYFEAQVRGKIDRVVLTGDGALTPEIAPLIAGAVTMPVEVGNPLSRFSVAPGVLHDVGSETAPLAVATGLALRTMN